MALRGYLFSWKVCSFAKRIRKLNKYPLNLQALYALIKEVSRVHLLLTWVLNLIYFIIMFHSVYLRIKQRKKERKIVFGS